MEEILKKLQKFLDANRDITPAYTFDDVLLEVNYSGLKPEDTIHISTLLCKGLPLKAPFISAAMDTVTGDKMAIMMARNGGIGIIHRNCAISEQCRQITQVKRHQGKMVTNPMTLNIASTIKDALKIYREFGFGTIPIVNQEDNLLIGLITERHLEDYGQDLSLPLSTIMVPFDDLTLAYDDTDLEKAHLTMKTKGKKRLPIVKSPTDHTLIGLYFKKDAQNIQKYPHMATDEKGRLLVGGAIGVGETGFERACALIKAGVDVLCIDTAQGDSIGVIEILKKLKQEFPHIPVIAGNVVTSEGAQRLINAGADAIKVGVGPGAICTTREITGNGMPQFTAIKNVAKATLKAQIPLIADGGIKTPGCVAKALAAGASCVMMGSIFSGTDEAPGDIIEQGVNKYKVYRGMGSTEAMQSQGGVADDRYGTSVSPSIKHKVSEGVSGLVPYKGSVQSILDTYTQALTQTMRVYQGAQDISELQENATFVLQTQQGKIESGIRVIV